MAIESISGTLLTNSPVSAKSTVKEATTVKSDTGLSSTSDTIEFTNTSQDIKSAVTNNSKTPPVNMERVAAIKSAIESGSYTVNANRVADKILQFDKQLPNSS